MEWFWRHYLPDPAERGNPEASPLNAGSFEGLPPAHIVTAEFDPLRGEGGAYAMRLQEAGVPVTHAHYDGVIHGFCDTSIFARKREAAQEAVQGVRAAVG